MHNAHTCTIPTYIELAVSKESLCQQLPRLDGQWCQLVLALQHVTDGVDVWHIRLLIDCWDVAIAGHRKG